MHAKQEDILKKCCKKLSYNNLLLPELKCNLHRGLLFLNFEDEMHCKQRRDFWNRPINTRFFRAGELDALAKVFTTAVPLMPASDYTTFLSVKMCQIRRLWRDICPQPIIVCYLSQPAWCHQEEGHFWEQACKQTMAINAVSMIQAVCNCFTVPQQHQQHPSSSLHHVYGRARRSNLCSYWLTFGTCHGENFLKLRIKEVISTSWFNS